MTRKIIEATQESVLNNSKGLSVAAIADMLTREKATSTPYQEINPNQRQGKLGVEEFVEIMKILDDFRPLEVMAATCGFRLVPINSSPDAPNFATECLQGYEAVASFLRDARAEIEAADREGRAPDYVRFSGHLAQAAKELRDVWARMRAMAEALRPRRQPCGEACQ